MPAPPPQNQGATAAGQDVRRDDDDVLRREALEAEYYAADQGDDPLDVGLEWVSDRC